MDQFDLRIHGICRRPGLVASTPSPTSCPGLCGANFEFLDDGAAVRQFRRNQQKLNQLSRKLPDHADYIRRVQTEPHYVIEGDTDLDDGPAHDLSDPLGREG